MTGGARIGWVNATWPFAKLSASAQQLSVSGSLIGRYNFSPDQVAALEPYGSISVLGTGVRIVHTVQSYPEKIIFWCFGSPKRLIERITNLGFRPSAFIACGSLERPFSSRRVCSMEGAKGPRYLHDLGGGAALSDCAIAKCFQSISGMGSEARPLHLRGPCSCDFGLSRKRNHAHRLRRAACCQLTPQPTRTRGQHRALSMVGACAPVAANVKQLDHSCACFRSFSPTTGPGLRGKPAGTPIFSSVSARFKRQRTSGSVVPIVASQQTKLSVSPPVSFLFTATLAI